MANKYKLITEMASQTARDISSNVDEYINFLKTAANNYKYDFMEQILIYAQKPEATACAEIDTWNKLGRWVNRGTKGIALLVDTSFSYKLRHVFDISDTNSRKGINVNLWKMKTRYEEAILESLKDSFGEIENDTNFIEQIKDIAGNLAKDNFADYLSQLQSTKEGSLLEDLDSLNTEVWFEDILKNSISYMALHRMGYDADKYFSKEDFSHVIDFNTTQTLSILGTATSDISEMFIKEIAETVKSLEWDEKIKNRTFADESKIEYIDKKDERREENGNDIQHEERLSNSRPNDTEISTDREVRIDEKELSQETSERDIHGDDARGNFEQSFSGDRDRSKSDDGENNREVEDTGGSERGLENEKSDEVGTDDEFNSVESGGDSEKRLDISIGLPTLEEQLKKIDEAGVENAPASFISQDVIDKVLQRGSAFQHGKLRIYEQFQKNQTRTENANFLKKEYGIGASFPAISGTHISQKHDEKGLEITDGDLFNPNAQTLLKWTDVEKRIGELIKADNYLTKEEKEKYLEETGKELTPTQIQFDYSNSNEEINEKSEDIKQNDEITDIDKEVKDDLTPSSQNKRRKNIPPNVLFPEIDVEDRTNFQIENDDIGVGTPLERFNNNISAIKLLAKLESEHRLATKDEQEILSNYVGWGGLSEFFEESNPHYLELKNLLTDEEYISARESTLTSFYTPPVVIKSIYKALRNMNFKTGNIIEPSCGIGNFMGLVPNSMNESKFYGVEIDKISGQIAQQLYQNSNIAVKGFEETNLPDSFFDVAVGNVPFGQFKVLDKKYDKHNFLIHDYFFARALDKVRPGGIIAFISSKGTMDKENPSVRKYIAQRADLLGAIRLPNNTFKQAAGTEVTSDIIFLQKRDRLIDIEPDWVHLNTDENGIRMNQYFVDNPDMILGDMQLISGPHGMEPACISNDEQDLEEQLESAIQNIHAEITEYEIDELEADEEDKSIPADPNVRNFSFTLVDDKVYYRENSRMYPADTSVTATNRIKGMIEIRECVRTLIEYQTEDYSDEEIKSEQVKLNRLYDDFVKKYGYINSRGNNSAFSQDSSYFLLASLEIFDDDHNFLRKADMFSKRTIKQKSQILSVDTATEAYALSLSEKAKVDMSYMMELTGKSEPELYDELKGIVFLNPEYSGDEMKPKYLSADEYLSGNVREKLNIAKKLAEAHPEDYEANVKALESVQPVDLDASEISVRLGATWIPSKVIEQFMFELFSTPRYLQWKIHANYSEYTGEWNIDGKSRDSGNVEAYSTYGTTRINGYKILEDTLNLRDVRIFDYYIDDEGKRQSILNKKETAIAQGKQELIKQAFADWIWKDQERREKLTKLYNIKFNSIRPREYDGSRINFVGINPEIQLKKHQVNAIARILYGGNTLLAHAVGAGKTFEMVASAQESKRLGLCQKSLFVVPNHLTEQWASEYLQLYPSANILVATKKDFEKKNRKKFCGRIATGDYDAVIIGHSQLEKIPISVERQRALLEQQLEEIMNGIEEIKRSSGDRFSIKQLEKTKKSVNQKLEKLNDQSRKDDVVTFEELGVDRIFIDEAHYYKNLAAFTKMRNVAGISQTEAMKSSDLYMKCRYLDSITGNKGVIFATGTPISNSMVEMYTMQKYLQYNALKKNGLVHFDAWASTFGETVTAIELAPEGTGYRAKTRFAKFYNLPELMAMFKEIADIQTADMLNLPVPKVNYHNLVLKPSDMQKEMVASLSERAEKVRNKEVDSTVDNMLLITNDGRKLALDQRLMNDMLPDSDTSKSIACVDNVYEIWNKTKEQKSTQMIFCDLSTPHNDGKFNIYDDLKNKLLDRGIPENEIAYIHSANTEAKKKELFGKVRSGQVRVLIGSTQKMGAGTNVQTKLCALHHLDCPWRPSDLQQREGRIVRQGNENEEVDIYTYVTENTFDSYLYQLVESKQKFIGQIMTSKSPVRSAEDVDETALSYAEVKALCAGNPHIKEKMDLDIEVSKLKLLKANHSSQKYALEDQIVKDFPERIRKLEERIDGFKTDIKHLEENTKENQDGFSPMQINGVVYTDKKEAGTALLEYCKKVSNTEPKVFGLYRGFEMSIFFDSFDRDYKISMKNELRHITSLGSDIYGNIQRLDNTLSGLEERLKTCEEQLENTKVQLENAKVQVKKPFPQEDELNTKLSRLNELNALLNLDKRENEIVNEERGDDEDEIGLEAGEKERDECEIER